MNKYKAKHWKTQQQIEVEYLTMQEAVMANKGYIEWEEI